MNLPTWQVYNINLHKLLRGGKALLLLHYVCVELTILKFNHSLNLGACLFLLWTEAKGISVHRFSTDHTSSVSLAAFL